MTHIELINWSKKYFVLAFCWIDLQTSLFFQVFVILKWFCLLWIHSIWHFWTKIIYIYIFFFISGSDETPPACQSDESVAAALKDIKMAIQATRVLQHQTRIIPSNSNSNNSMNPTAAAINSTVVSSTVNLTSIELVKYRVVKSHSAYLAYPVP